MKVYDQPVSELMSKGVVSVKEDTTVKEAAGVLIKNKISGAMVVSRDDKPMGVISEIDMAAALNNGKTGSPVKDCMSREVYAITPESSVRDAAKIMTENEIDRLFVYPAKTGKVTATEMPQGILSSRDIIRTLAANSRSR
jgi:predicted transcriptional regulator